MIKRRGRLAVLLAAALLVSGCAASADPRLDVSATPWPRSDLWQKAADAENYLAGVYAVAATTLPACGAWCPAAEAMHEAHATVLAQPDPFGGFTTPTVHVLPEFGDEATLAQALTQAAEDCLTADKAGLAAAQPGPEALLWASLVATAGVSVAWTGDPSVARPAPVPGDVVPSRIDISTADAANAVLSGVNGLIYAMTVASAQATTSKGMLAQLATQLTDAQSQSSALQAQIRAAGGIPAAPALAYPLSDGVGSDAAITASLNTLKAGMAVAYIRWAGTLTGDAAVTAATQADLAGATAMGQTITWWPGWG